MSVVFLQKIISTFLWHSCENVQRFWPVLFVDLFKILAQRNQLYLLFYRDRQSAYLVPDFINPYRQRRIWWRKRRWHIGSPRWDDAHVPSLALAWVSGWLERLAVPVGYASQPDGSRPKMQSARPLWIAAKNVRLNDALWPIKTQGNGRMSPTNNGWSTDMQIGTKVATVLVTLYCSTIFVFGC